MNYGAGFMVLNCRVEEEVTARAVLLKQLREKEDDVQELQEDLESEKKARAKAEKTKNDLNEVTTYIFT